jgi:hypothetical protein
MQSTLFSAAIFAFSLSELLWTFYAIQPHLFSIKQTTECYSYIWKRGSCNSPLTIYFFIIILSGVRLSPLGTAATTGLFYQPQMIHDGDCGAICGLKIDRGTRSTRRKPAPVPLCPPQIPHNLTQARTRAARMGTKLLTAWVIVRPVLWLVLSSTDQQGKRWSGYDKYIANNSEIKIKKLKRPTNNRSQDSSVGIATG